MSDPRHFESIFQDVSQHPSGLCRVTTESWWDGEILLIEGRVTRRNHTMHAWADDKGMGGARLLVFGDHESKGSATRAAIIEHDSFAKQEFVALDADLARQARCGADADDRPISSMGREGR